MVKNIVWQASLVMVKKTFDVLKNSHIICFEIKSFEMITTLLIKKINKAYTVHYGVYLDYVQQNTYVLLFITNQ